MSHDESKEYRKEVVSRMLKPTGRSWSSAASNQGTPASWVGKLDAELRGSYPARSHVMIPKPINIESSTNTELHGYGSALTTFAADNRRFDLFLDFQMDKVRLGKRLQEEGESQDLKSDLQSWIKDETSLLLGSGFVSQDDDGTQEAGEYSSVQSAYHVTGTTGSLGEQVSDLAGKAK